MSNINKDKILEEILLTLVAGWGKSKVQATLDQLSSRSKSSQPERSVRKKGSTEEVPDAVSYVEELDFVENRSILLRFAEAFDNKRAFPTSTDIRQFLLSQNVYVKEVKSRNQAFRRILPVLQGMSSKGLLKALDRAQYSGPTRLDEISDAIKSAGQLTRRDRDEGSSEH